MKSNNIQFSGTILLPFVTMTLVVVFWGCEPESEFEKQQAASDLEIENFIKNNGINAKVSEHGLYYEALIENESGQIPKGGEVLAIKYEIRTLGGKLLESSTEDSTLVRFGWNYVLPNGLVYGFDVLKKGEKIRFYLPSYLAYQSYSSKDMFGPNTNFVMDLELVDIMTEDDIYETQIDQIEQHIEANLTAGMSSSGSGLYFQTLEAGKGIEANSGHVAKLHYKRTYLNGTLIQATDEDKPLSVDLNSNQLVKGFKEGVLKMKEGEKALLIMPADIAFGASIKVIPSTLRHELWEGGYVGSLVDPYEIVVYEVELLELR